MEKTISIRIVDSNGTIITATFPESTSLADIQTTLIGVQIPQSVIDAYQLALSARNNFNGLPNWATWTASDAETNITTSIFAGQSAATVKANIASQLTDITTANVSQINIRLAVIRTLFGNAVDAIITIRGILVAIGKGLVYLRDLVVKL